MACEKGLSEAVEQLLNAGAGPNVTACDLLPVHIALKTNNMRSEFRLVEY